MDYCIGKAAKAVDEFYLLPVGDKLIQYDTIAVNTIVKNKEGEVSSWDVLFTSELEKFNSDYLKYTKQVAENCKDRDLSENCMVIGTSAIIDTEIDGAVGMNSGIFNNPFIIGVDTKRNSFAIICQFHFNSIIHRWMAHMLEDFWRSCSQK